MRVWAAAGLAVVTAALGAGVALLALDAEREHADLVDAPAGAQGLEPAEGKESSVEAAEHLVVVGEAERNADRPTVLLGHECEVLVEDRSQLLRVGVSSASVSGTKPQLRCQASL